MPGGAGYTVFSERAGVYSFEEAQKIVNGALDGWNPQPDGTDMLPHEVMVHEHAYSLTSAVAEATVAMVLERVRDDA